MYASLLYVLYNIYSNLLSAVEKAKDSSIGFVWFETFSEPARSTKFKTDSVINAPWMARVAS
jgi:hypothetical protein